ncbi:MAG TPA: hypothetical protein VIP08_08825 [Phenylobacterium sp.]|uniref:hypothetical protein n=1 Tax=Phenylobacterium sp. TaxID=1871053 RepID=UPI002F92E858
MFYVNRLFPELPLYAGDEGAYLIRALYGDRLLSHPDAYRQLQSVDNAVYFFLIRLVDALSLNVLPWLRLIGAASYFGGLGLLYTLAVKACGRTTALGFLLIASLFPFYRFVFTAMPEGLFIGLLCLIAWVLHQTYLSRPRLNAIIAGALIAILVLLKPHGLVAGISFVVVSFIDTWLRKGTWASLGGRLILFAAAFMATGTAIGLLADRSLRAALLFFQGSYYGQQLSHAPGPDSLFVALLAAGSMVAWCAVLMAVPVLAGLRKPVLRLLGRTEEQLDQGDVVFLFVLLCAAGAIAMVTIFAFKVSFMVIETRRIWGRYFEFYTPLLWLLAAGPLSRWEAVSRWRDRLPAAVLILLGACGLLLVFALGVQLFPWDGTAIEAFTTPEAVRFPFGYLGGSRLLAFVATVAIAAATLFGVRLRVAWPAYFVILGLLSTRSDDAWVGELARRNRAVEHELHIARNLTTGSKTLVIASEMNDGHIAFLRLDGRTSVVVDPGAPPPELTRGYRHLVVLRDRPVGEQWSRSFRGEALSIYDRKMEKTAP